MTLIELLTLIDKTPSQRVKHLHALARDNGIEDLKRDDPTRLYIAQVLSGSWDENVRNSKAAHFDTVVSAEDLNLVNMAVATRLCELDVTAAKKAEATHRAQNRQTLILALRQAQNYQSAGALFLRPQAAGVLKRLNGLEELIDRLAREEQ